MYKLICIISGWKWTPILFDKNHKEEKENYNGYGNMNSVEVR